MPFLDLVGNAGVLGRLSLLIRAGRLPPSLIFSGGAGVGKLEAAVTLAQALNCPAGGGDPCGRCSTCVRIARDEHPDVRILRPEGRGGQIRAEGVREAIAGVPFRPFEGKRRVIVLADAERMNPTTANTLLKTLEEPPPWATIVLVTGNEAAMLPTILSRCQVFRFSPLAPEELIELLVKRHDLPSDRAALLAAVSGGGLTRALELTEEPLSELRKEALALAGIAVFGARAQELVPRADALSKEGRLMLLLDILLSLIRDLSARKAGAGILHRDIEPEIDALSERASLSVWLSAYELVEGALVDMRDRYLNKRITLSRLLLSLHELSAG
ncbi:MAG: ATP-binding protein [Vicinamibacteria bacterium]